MSSAIPDHVSDELIHPFDFRLDPRIETDPWSFFASAADLPEVFWSPDLGGHWVLARAARIQEAWMRPDLFSARSVSVPRIDSPYRLIPSNLDPPEHRQQLIDDPAKIPNAVEELLRRFSAPNLGRIVAQDCTFAGVPMREGDMVLVSTTIAGLDGERFERPFEVDFDRPGLKAESLSFGTGIHMCSGHALARTELAITLQELLPRLPNLRLCEGAEIQYASGGTLTITTPVPLEWDA